VGMAHVLVRRMDRLKALGKRRHRWFDADLIVAASGSYYGRPLRADLLDSQPRP
jgi:hypothetical protein